MRVGWNIEKEDLQESMVVYGVSDITRNCVRHNKGGNSRKVKWGGKLSRSEAMNLCRKLNFTNPEGKERGRYRDSGDHGLEGQSTRQNQWRSVIEVVRG
jgi:hypothetical protein